MAQRKPLYPSPGWLTLTAWLMLLAWQTPAFTRAFTDAEIVSLCYLFGGMPIYLLLLGASFLAPRPGGPPTAPSASRTIRTCANLLPFGIVAALLVYRFVVLPHLPPHYSDWGFLFTWACILSPPVLAALATFLVRRWPGIYEVTSKAWWLIPYGALAALAAAKLFLD